MQNISALLEEIDTDLDRSHWYFSRERTWLGIPINIEDSTLIVYQDSRKEGVKYSVIISDYPVFGTPKYKKIASVGRVLRAVKRWRIKEGIDFVAVDVMATPVHFENDRRYILSVTIRKPTETEISDCINHSEFIEKEQNHG